jgi:peroxiredoxin
MTMRMTKWMVPAALTVAAAACWAAAVPAAPKAGVAVGETAPAFTLDDQNGKAVSLRDYKGKIIVLEWTNKDCPFIQRHLKARTMPTLAEKYKSQDVVWLAIDSTSTHDTATNFKTVTDHKLPFPLLNDSKGIVGKEYGAKSTPDMFVINKDGVIVYMGAIDDDPAGEKTSPVNYVSQALDEILAGKSVKTPETKSYGCSVKYAD